MLERVGLGTGDRDRLMLTARRLARPVSGAIGPRSTSRSSSGRRADRQPRSAHRRGGPRPARPGSDPAAGQSRRAGGAPRAAPPAPSARRGWTRSRRCAMCDAAGAVSVRWLVACPRNPSQPVVRASAILMRIPADQYPRGGGPDPAQRGEQVARRRGLLPVRMSVEHRDGPRAASGGAALSVPAAESVGRRPRYASPLPEGLGAVVSAGGSGTCVSRAQARASSTVIPSPSAHAAAVSGSVRNGSGS